MSSTESAHPGSSPGSDLAWTDEEDVPCIRTAAPWNPRSEALRAPSVDVLCTSGELGATMSRAVGDHVPRGRCFDLVRSSLRSVRQAHRAWDLAFDTINTYEPAIVSAYSRHILRSAVVVAGYGARMIADVGAIMSSLIDLVRHPRRSGRVGIDALNLLMDRMVRWDVEELRKFTEDAISAAEATADLFESFEGSRGILNNKIARSSIKCTEACASAAVVALMCAALYNDTGAFVAACGSMLSSLEIDLARTEFVVGILEKIR